MKIFRILLYSVLSAFLPLCLQAQTLKIGSDNNPNQYLILSKDTVYLNYNDFASVGIARNCDYDVSNGNQWIVWKKQGNGNLSLFATPNYNVAPRTGLLTLSTADGSLSRALTVIQKGRTVTDRQIPIVSGTANQAQSGEDISKSYDDNLSTLYHSPWTGTSFPVILTYNLQGPAHVDYALYTPRQDGNNNGNFEQVDIDYQVSGSTQWIRLRTANLGGSGSIANISFGDEGIDDVMSIRFTVRSGVNGFASCAEMAFYEKDDFIGDMLKDVFADKLCTRLKDGVTREMIEQMEMEEFRSLAYQLQDGTYSMKYRVGEFKAYRPVADLRNELKNSYTYNNHENPTGITFKKDENVIVVVEGIGDSPVTLQVRNFGPEDFNTEYYPLSNGVNIINCRNKGNGYIDYYTKNYKDAPKVKIHFVNGVENGYFDLERGDTNDDWKALLANAKGDCMDFVSKNIQGVFPVSALKANCPTNGVWLVTTYDSIVSLEQEVMGLKKYNRKYDNHMAVISVKTSGGLYHASNDGFCVPINALRDPTSSTYFDFWGAAHELGHVNQTNGMLWIGLTEVTNNIYSAYVEHMLRPNGYHRLENESNGFRYYDFMEYNIMKGGQFVPHAHNDVFCTLIPFWQLLVYTKIAGIQPDAYPEMFEKMRTMDVGSMDDGHKQVNFMRQWCDITKTNYLPYFAKVGMFKTVNEEIGDYSTRQLTITQSMLNELRSHVESAGYPEAPEAFYFLDVNNMPAFRDKAPLVANEVNAGCVRSGNTVKIEHSAWKNVVGFETYDAQGNLLHITSYGHGSAAIVPTTTNVEWISSENPAYIMAVGYDGKKVKCYQP